MPRMLGPSSGNLEIGIGDSTVRRHKDGTFHVNAHTAALMKKSGDYITVGVKINGKGFRCQQCDFLALLSDHCGRCGCTELRAE